MNLAGYKNLKNLTHWVKVFLFIYIFFTIGSMISGYFKHPIVSENLLEKVSTLITYATLALCARWVYLANSNASRLTYWPIKHSPLWSIGCYFVPVVNLWEPYVAMKEIWEVSEKPSNPSQAQGTIALPIWWILYLLANLLFVFLHIFSSPSNAGAILSSYTTTAIIFDFLCIFLALSFFRIVNEICKNQTINHMKIIDDRDVIDTKNTSVL